MYMHSQTSHAKKLCTRLYRKVRGISPTLGITLALEWGMGIFPQLLVFCGGKCWCESSVQLIIAHGYNAKQLD